MHQGCTRLNHAATRPSPLGLQAARENPRKLARTLKTAHFYRNGGVGYANREKLRVAVFGVVTMVVGTLLVRVCAAEMPSQQSLAW